MPDVDPVGIKDIAERLGVKQQTAAMWNHRGILPTPKWEASGIPLWDWPEIEAWHRNRSGRGIPRETAST